MKPREPLLGGLDSARKPITQPTTKASSIDALGAIGGFLRDQGKRRHKHQAPPGEKGN